MYKGGGGEAKSILSCIFGDFSEFLGDIIIEFEHFFEAALVNEWRRGIAAVCLHLLAIVGIVCGGLVRGEAAGHGLNTLTDVLVVLVKVV